MFTINRIGLCAILLCTLIAGSYVLLSDNPVSYAAERQDFYDESGNGREQIDAALAKAQAEGKNVLIQFGGNWCGWCHLLHELFQSNEAIATALRNDYVVVNIDTNTNEDLVNQYVTKLEGVPYLTVLAPDGKVLKNQPTGPLEVGPKHDPEKVLAFLNEWKPAPIDAEAAVKAALDQAKSEDKLVLLHFGAPSCGWCRRLDAFLAMPEVAELVGKDYIPVKIDLARMTNAESVNATYRKTRGGIPWMALVDGNGAIAITSDGPEGNIGYPVKESEIAYFKTMIEKTATHMTEADRNALIDIANKEAAAIRASRG